MTTHQLHETARALSLRLGITHGEACAMLARRKRSARPARKAAPITANNAQKQPASYWWQNLDQ